MALVAFHDLPPYETAPSARAEAFVMDFLFKPAIQLVIAFEETGLAHRCLGRQVRVDHFEHVAPGPYAVAKGVPSVPEQIKRLAHHVLGRRFVAEEHQIDIRVRVHLSSAVSPQG